MGTLIYYIFFTKNFDYGDMEGLNKFGKILKCFWISFMSFLMLIAMLPFLIIENVFMFPAYLIYNLAHIEKCSYKQFWEKLGGKQ